jgi:hypothetical protein
MDMILHDLARLKAFPLGCIWFVLTQRSNIHLGELGIKIVINSFVDNIAGASILFNKYRGNTVHFLQHN